MSDRTARCMLVTGLPAVGKSTVCRLVAEGLDRSTVIDADVVRESIVGGFIEPELPFSDAFIEQAALQRVIVNEWADRMVGAGYHVVIDDAPIPLPPHFRQQYERVLADPTSLPVLLTASRSALLARLDARNGPFDAWFRERLDDVIGAGDVHDWTGWTVIDTSDLTPADVAARILDLL